MDRSRQLRRLLALALGQDTIFARDGLPDEVTGGPGRDTVYADRQDTIRLVERRL